MFPSTSPTAPPATATTKHHAATSASSTLKTLTETVYS
jgi:hypothetical protein